MTTVFEWIRQPLPDYVTDGATDLDITSATSRDISDLGWRIAFGWWWSWSLADPIFRTVRLTGWQKLTWRYRMRLLLHERTHVAQWGRRWPTRWWRLALYLIVPSVRLRMEIEARAHANAAETLVMWQPGQPCPGLPGANRAGTLTDFRAPYFTGADRADVEAALEARLAELLAGFYVEAAIETAVEKLMDRFGL